MKHQEEQLNLLKKELGWMHDATEVLSHSYKACMAIGIKEKYTVDQLERFEALTSRFARLSDIILQKIMRLIDIIELEAEGSIRDRINRAEKRELINSASQFVDIRLLRNSIAHEYLPEAIARIFKQVLALTPILLDASNKIKNYCKRYPFGA